MLLFFLCFLFYKAICREDCHPTHGYCEAAGECRCRIGYAGKTCRDCQVLPGCQHGTCTNPLECKCFPGWRGFLCEQGLCEISLYFIVLNSQLTISKFITSIIAICSATCSKMTGYCTKPGTCRCKIGWMGENCTQCHPYPGCQNGDCRRPWVISFKLYILQQKKPQNKFGKCYHTIYRNAIVVLVGVVYYVMKN